GRARYLVRAGAGRGAGGRTAVRRPLSPDLDDDRLLHSDGARPDLAGGARARAAADHSRLRRGLRRIVDRPRHAAAGLVRAGALSAADGEAGVPEPDRAGAGAVGRRVPDRGERHSGDDRRLDRAGDRQRRADRRAMGAQPETATLTVGTFRSAWAGAAL